jgi:polysaccharide biosynthesis/export protein
VLLRVRRAGGAPAARTLVTVFYEDGNVMLNRIFLLLGLAFFALIGTATAHAAGEYVLATGDLVRVTVYDHADLTTETRVNEQGSILFPLVGEVPVAGRSASEASSRIAKALEAGGFIRGPQVNLVVIDFKGQEVSVLGQVNRPGKFPLQKASRLAEVLALAGGVTVNGADSLILISNKDGKTVRQEIDLLALFKDGAQELNVAIANDDILYVPREPRYYIYGEVQRPGAFRLEKNMSLVQALSVGGGLTARGTQKGIKILRRGQDGVMQEIEAKLSDLLKTDDVIFVKESLF